MVKISVKVPSCESLTEAGGSASEVCWQEASVPLHVGFTTGLLDCPQDLALTSSRVRDSRENRQSHNVFYDLASNVTCHHLCHILLISQTSHDTVQEGKDKDTKGGEHWGTPSRLGTTDLCSHHPEEAHSTFSARQKTPSCLFLVSIISPRSLRGSHYSDFHHH